MEEQREEFERTHQWMFKNAEQLSIEQKEEQLKLPSIEDQCSGDKSRETKPLDGWTYKNVNAVFYHPAGAPMSDQEKIDLAKKEKQIVRENTRFKSNPWKGLDKGGAGQKAESLVAAKKESELGKVGVDGKDLVDPRATPTVNGFKLLRLDHPSPQFSVSESPLMTWGQVESTPYRLEGADEDTLPVNLSGGPQFKIQDIPKRDRLAFELAEKNSKFYRDKKNKAILKARSHLKTPKSLGNLTTRVATMSPAAQRLATAKLGIRIGTDKALKAAYTPSPARRQALSTPSRAKCKRAPTPATPKLDSDTSITDDLLNLPPSSTSGNSTSKERRSKASDFL